MPNDTTLRSLIHAALDSSPIPELDLTTIHRRAAQPKRAPAPQLRKRRIAAIVLAIALPTVAFAATPQLGIQATLRRLAIAYFGPKAETSIEHGYSLGRPRTFTSPGPLGRVNSVKVILFNKHQVVAMPLAMAVRRASEDFHVIVPSVPAAWGKPGSATYVNNTIDYTYLFGSRESVLVTIAKTKRTPSRQVKPHKFQGFTARFNGSGHLISSHLMHIAGFSLGDEILTLASPNIPIGQLDAIGTAAGGREIGHSN